ncbi:MAG: potassium-transporting ATPase subunit KdpA [Verrucomicrobia bacterium]|nr:potassium-transporting ATPase subunit KdpA [Verrucomicrobiota bacterium]
MEPSDWLTLILYLAALALLTKPLGILMVAVLEGGGGRPWDRILKPLEILTGRLTGTDPRAGQTWLGYTKSILAFSFCGFLLTFFLLGFQGLLPLNPSHFPGPGPDLAFNTTVSYLTNTDWQSYGGESSLSHLSQMVALTYHNFTSAAVGMAVAAALVRGITRGPGATVGNFWNDLVRVTCLILLPASLVLSVLLASQGVIQNFDPPTRAATLEGREQIMAQGPVASQAAIKILGTNGGGFMRANAAHPFENPTALGNFLQMLAIPALGSGLTHYLGRMSGNQAHGWAVWTAMICLLVSAVVICASSEAAGNPIHHQLGIARAEGNMEGKEVRFGIFHSALFASLTAAASCGAVNCLHDSFTPVGGLVPLFLIDLGEVVIGGAGAGLYGMLVFVILTVFIAGLMVGRTPEYLGKKIGAAEIRLAVIALLTPTGTILVFTALASVSRWGLEGPGNPGPHGLTEILYAYSSATGNNGSAFAGLATDTPPYNLTLALAMLTGRFLVILPVMAIAGSLAAKQPAPPGAGTFPVDGPTFTVLLLATVLLVGALNFFPVLTLGPIVEHFLMHQGHLF